MNYFMRRRKRQNNGIIDWFLKPFKSDRSVHQPDLVLLSAIGLLLFFGLLFLSSASSTQALYNFDDSYRFVKQQTLHGLLPGLLIFYIAIRIKYTLYRKFALVFLILSFLLLVAVFASSFASDYGTAQSWIVVGNFSFQPSEFVKLFFILFLAGWFDRKGNDVKSFASTTIPFVVLLSIISLFIIKQPDFGTLSIIIAIAMALFFAAGARWTHLFAIIVSGGLVLGAMVKAAPYRMNRITAWLNPEIDPQGIGWQIKQSLIAVGSGGWFGVGLGASKQKSYLPQASSDSIFSIIAEEIGFLFVVGILILFCVLFYRIFLIAKNSDDNFAKLVAVGIAIWISAQVFVNIAGMIQLFPLTGVPLTFISLGGSNLVITMLAMGILANISKYTNKNA